MNEYKLTTSSILVLPGLGSHPVGSFKEKHGNNVWIRDFLPKDIPMARILIYGYNTSVTDSNAKHSIPDLAMAFLRSVEAFRAATKVVFAIVGYVALLTRMVTDYQETAYSCSPQPWRFTSQGGLLSPLAL